MEENGEKEAKLTVTGLAKRPILFLYFGNRMAILLRSQFT